MWSHLLFFEFCYYGIFFTNLIHGDCLLVIDCCQKQFLTTANNKKTAISLYKIRGKNPILIELLLIPFNMIMINHDTCKSYLTSLFKLCHVATHHSSFKRRRRSYFSGYNFLKTQEM